MAGSRHVGIQLKFTTGLAHPAAESRHGGLYVLPLFLIFIIFYDSCQSNYLKIYWTDFRKILRLVELRVWMIKLEISFSIPQGTLTRKQFSWFYLQN